MSNRMVTSGERVSLVNAVSYHLLRRVWPFLHLCATTRLFEVHFWAVPHSWDVLLPWVRMESAAARVCREVGASFSDGASQRPQLGALRSGGQPPSRGGGRWAAIVPWRSICRGHDFGVTLAQ